MELRDRLAYAVAKALCDAYQVPVRVQDKDYWVADALIKDGWVR